MIVGKNYRIVNRSLFFLSYFLLTEINVDLYTKLPAY